MPLMQGQLITFEGVEGAGKTTQLAQLCPWLAAAGYIVQTTREPGGTDLGAQIRTLLLHGGSVSERAELLLYAADRAHHVQTVLRPALAQGHWVLCDRYTDSTVAYQGYGRGLERALIDQINQIATAGLVPDLTLWLDLEVNTGLERIQRRSGPTDRMEQATLAFHQRVRQGFSVLAQTQPQRVVQIDASQPVEQVQQAVRRAVKQRLGVSGEL